MDSSRLLSVLLTCLALSATLEAKHLNHLATVTDFRAISLVTSKPPPRMAATPPPRMAATPPPRNAATPPPPAVSSKYNTTDSYFWVGLINSERGNYFQSYPVRWNASLASQAQVWANNVSAAACASGLVTGLPYQSPYGQRIYSYTYTTGGSPASIPTVFYSWQAQALSYNVTKYTCATGANCKDWLQMVYQQTSSLGCGIATCPLAKTPTTTLQVTVCNFFPALLPGPKPF